MIVFASPYALDNFLVLWFEAYHPSFSIKYLSLICKNTYTPDTYMMCVLILLFLCVSTGGKPYKRRHNPMGSKVWGSMPQALQGDKVQFLKGALKTETRDLLIL